MTHLAAPHPDELLAHTLAHGDAAAWRRLEREHGSKIRRSIARVIHRFPGLCASDTIEDVAAELSIRLLKNRGAKLTAFRAGRGLTLEQWLMRIAKQAAYDHVRRLRRRRTAPLELDLVIAAADDPHADYLARQRSEMLQAAVKTLPTRERQLYELCFRSHAEPERAAELMGIRIATVYSKKHKLMSRLSRVLSDDAALAA
jgi:RNA polymerase sigma factor (sigma-70 family)